MKGKRKGQGALEYLMTYGWALLIIVVVGAALFALGVFSPQTREGCTGFAYFQYSDLRLTSANDFNLVVINGNQDVTINSVQWDTSSNTTVTPTTSQSTGTQITIAGTVAPTLSRTSGASYSDAVIINYTTTAGTKSDRATCSGKVI